MYRRCTTGRISPVFFDYLDWNFSGGTRWPPACRSPTATIAIRWHIALGNSRKYKGGESGHIRNLASAEAMGMYARVLESWPVMSTNQRSAAGCICRAQMVIVSASRTRDINSRGNLAFSLSLVWISPFILAGCCSFCIVDYINVCFASRWSPDHTPPPDFGSRIWDLFFPPISGFPLSKKRKEALLATAALKYIEICLNFCWTKYIRGAGV